MRESVTNRNVRNKTCHRLHIYYIGSGVIFSVPDGTQFDNSMSLPRSSISGDLIVHS